MTAISSRNRTKIKGYLEGFINGLVDEYQGRTVVKPTSGYEYLMRTSPKGELKPFQAAIIPPELIRINQFERGLSTRLGNSLEECARLIALEHHQDARRGFDLVSEISLSALAEAEIQKERYESATQSLIGKPSFEEMITFVLEAIKSNDLVTKKVRADLYILADDGTEFFFEIKSPKPNKGQCLEVIQRLLRFYVFRGYSRPQIQAYYAMPYNPYGSQKADYKWPQALKYLPFDEMVIMGQDFWNLVGGATAYEELLEIYMEVGTEKGKHMLDSLALGF